MSVKMLQGPYFDRAKNMYRIQWIEGNERQYKLFDSELSAKEFKATLRGSVVTSDIKVMVPGHDPSTAKFWAEATGAIALALLESANEGDDDLMDRIGKLARAYAPLATAALKLLDREQLEAKLLELEEQMRANITATKIGSRQNTNSFS